MFWIYFCSSFIFLGSINGYSRFQMLIPNGDRVKHPCRNEIWNAVGHMQPNHIPQKNSFGLVRIPTVLFLLYWIGLSVCDSFKSHRL